MKAYSIEVGMEYTYGKSRAGREEAAWKQRSAKYLIACRREQAKKKKKAKSNKQA